MQALNTDNQVIRRRLAIGDFEGLNQLVYNAVVKLPDISVAEGFVLNLSVSDMKCTNFKIGDVLLTHERIGSRQVKLHVDILQLDMMCSLNYRYQTLFFSGNGPVDVYSKQNTVETETVWTTPSRRAPPTGVELISCRPDINLNDFDFKEGGILAFAPVESLLRRIAQRQAERAMCNELSKALSNKMKNLLKSAQQLLTRYPSLASLNVEPLDHEQNLIVPQDVNLLNLKDKQTASGKNVQFAVREAIAFLSQRVNDPHGVRKFGTDLRINVMLRDLLLDENRALNVMMKDLPGDGILYDSHDRLTETLISLHSVRLKGLDTFTKFKPLGEIGNMTLQNELSWRYLSFEFDLDIVMKASSLETSIISKPTQAVVRERVTIKFGVQKLDALAAIVLAVNQQDWDALQLGSLLQTVNLLPCLRSIIFDLELSALPVTVESVRPPTMSGFVSKGIDRIVTNAINLAFELYESSLLKAAPAFFQTTIREIVNRGLMDSMQANASENNASCPWVEINNGDSLEQQDFVDVRDLLLSPEEAMLEGATGTLEFGDLPSIARELFTKQFLDNDEDGSPKLNSVIRAATETQSGTEGILSFPESQVEYSIDLRNRPYMLVDRLEFQSSSLTLSNTDSLVSPVELATPVGAHEMTNQLRFSGPLVLGTKFLLHVEGDNSPIAMRNEFQVSFSLSHVSLLLDIMLRMRRKQFMEFPLSDLSNLHCWLATLPPPLLDEFGNDSASKNDSSVSLTGLDVAVSGFNVDVSCISCSSPGGEALPEIIATFKESGAMILIEESIQQLLVELGVSYWDSMKVPLMVSESRKLCPHGPFYDSSFSSTFQWPTLPHLSRDATETMIMLSVVGLEFGGVVTAKSHLMDASTPTHPLSAEMTALYEGKNTTLINFQTLNTTLGQWAAVALEEAQSYLSSSTVEGNEQIVGANILMRQLLDKDGLINVDMKPLKFGHEGEFFKLLITSVRVSGLDSIYEAAMLEPLGRHTFFNEIRFEHIGLDIFIDVETKSKEGDEIFSDSIRLSVTLDDVDLQAAVYFAVDLDHLLDLEFRSLLHFKNLLPCLLSKMRGVSLTQLKARAGHIGHLVVDGMLSGSKMADLEKVTDKIFTEFKEDMLLSMPKVFDTTIREIINGLLEETLNQNDFCNAVNETFAGIVDFRDFFLTDESARALGGTGSSPYGDVFPVVFESLQGHLRDEKLVSSWFSGLWNDNPDGIYFEGDLFNSTANVTLSKFEALLESKVSSVSLQNLDSIRQPILLLQPVEGSPNTLNNTITFGSDQLPLHLGAVMSLSFNDGEAIQMNNRVAISVDVRSITFILSMVLMIVEDKIFSLPLAHLSNPNCWMDSISTETMIQQANSTSLLYYAVLAERLDLNISCVECSSPRFDELISTLYSPGRTQEDATAFVRQIKDLVDTLLGSDFFENIILKIVNDAAKRCPSNEQYDPSAPTGDYWTQPATYLGYESLGRDRRMVWFNIANAIVAVSLILFAVVAWLIIQKRNRDWIKSLGEDEILLLQDQDKEECDKDNFLDKNTKSMFRSEQIPRRVRYMVPVAIILNVALFLAGHLALVSYLNIRAQVAGEPMNVYNFMHFTFFTSAVRTYENGGNEMAVLVIIFSGIWPYLKLVTSLVLWFIPPKKISVVRRGYIFLWLDVLTKLSIVDVFMILVAIATLLVYVGGPGKELYDEGDLYSMAIEVVPSFGFYCIVIAQRLSRVGSRFFLDYHKKIIAAATSEYKRKTTMTKSDEEDATYLKEVSMSLHSHLEATKSEKNLQLSSRYSCSDFLVYENESSEDEGTLTNSIPSQILVRQTKGGRDFCKCCCRGAWIEEVERKGVLRGTVGVIFGIVSAVTILIIGAVFSPSATVDIESVLGIALESGRSFEEAVDDFNVFRVVSVVLLQTRFVLDNPGDFIGLGILICIAILTSVMFPAIEWILKIRKWFLSRNESGPKSLPGFYNRLKAYRHLEVHITAFCFACWQLGAVVAYVIHTYCNSLGRLYESLSYVGIVERTSAQCFAIQVAAPSTSGIIAGSFILLLASFIRQAVEQYKENKYLMSDADH